MYIPSSITATSDRGLESFPHIASPSVGGWSSIIGVVTAICGNILISFALNTQRYAHIRLSRDREQAAQQEKRKAKRRKPSSSSPRLGYGTARQQQQIADGREELNSRSEPNSHLPGVDPEEEDDVHASSEQQPLIPKIDGRASSRSSEDTARADEDDNGKDEDAGKEKSYLGSPIWWLGIALMVVGEAGNFLAYGFAPASIVSPLGVVALVSNCLIAPLLLGEKFRWRDGLGVLIAIAGCVVVVLSASASNPKLTPGAIWQLISKWEFETYFGITVVLMIALAVASSKFGQSSILIDLGLVALFGGYTALSTKGVASLLSNTIWRVVTFPITYLLVAVLVFTAVMQIKYLNRALQRFDATMVIPTQFVLFTISVIVGSAVLYRDFERESTADAIKFVCGCALTFFGVWCITSGRAQEPKQGEHDLDDDAIDLVDEEHVMPEIHHRDDGEMQRRSSQTIASARDTSGPGRPSTTVAVPDPVPEIKEVVSSPPADGLLGLSDVSALQQRLSHMSPANASTIHSTPTGALWRESSGKTPPPLHATTSAPIIPTAPSLSTSLRPKTPLNRSPSGPPTDSPSKAFPTTPQGNSVTLLEPDAPSANPRLLNRPSVVDLLPGPLTSPLSGSLSAIVADELRRNLSLTVRRKSGKSQSRPRIFLSQTSENRVAGMRKRHSIASVDVDAEEAAAALRREAVSGAPAVPGSPTAPEGGRMRSLSATLGEIFGATTRTTRRATVVNNATEETGSGSRGRTTTTTTTAHNPSLT